MTKKKADSIPAEILTIIPADVEEAVQTLLRLVGVVADFNEGGPIGAAQQCFLTTDAASAADDAYRFAVDTSDAAFKDPALAHLYDLLYAAPGVLRGAQAGVTTYEDLNGFWCALRFAHDLAKGIAWRLVPVGEPKEVEAHV